MSAIVKKNGRHRAGEIEKTDVGRELTQRLSSYAG